MPRRKLSAIWVESVKPPPSGREEHFDRALPGFGLRIAASGIKSWVIFYRVDRADHGAPVPSDAPVHEVAALSPHRAARAGRGNRPDRDDRQCSARCAAPVLRRVGSEHEGRQARQWFNISGERFCFRCPSRQLVTVSASSWMNNGTRAGGGLPSCAAGTVARGRRRMGPAPSRLKSASLTFVTTDGRNAIPERSIVPLMANATQRSWRWPFPFWPWRYFHGLPS